MSLLISSATADAVWSLSDTLGVLLGAPRVNHQLGFGAKVHAIPHLDAMTGGCGAGAVMDPWAAYVQHATLARNAEELSVEAPAVLSEIAEAAFGSNDGPATTIHIWGWSAARGSFVAYQHDSASGYLRRETPPGALSVRPKPDFAIPVIATFDDVLALVRAIKDADACLAGAGEKSCRIGGHLVQHWMEIDRTTGLTRITSANLGPFDDFQTDHAAAERVGFGSPMTVLGLHNASVGQPPRPNPYLAMVGCNARRAAGVSE